MRHKTAISERVPGTDNTNLQIKASYGRVKVSQKLPSVSQKSTKSTDSITAKN